LVTTNNGTLIGVYDIRRNSGTDLQEDIDVGMSRSTDGGENWEPMKVIMDMKEWGGLPNNQNGIGDPSVLVDRTTNTIWVAAVWAHGHPGQRNWWASKPGVEPAETSQLVLVKSEDDGVTWSEPINITNQIKKMEWYLLLQGPGKGITLKDGTFVFPAQFKDKEQMPHSTIIWSKDQGKTWNIGTGAKSNTTEAQVIELNDGGLMLNMRDNRNETDKSETNGRAVAVTYDLGKTWKTHATSNGVLKEPTCMASLIKEDFMVEGKMKSLVLFSNPNSKFGRHHITIKVSLDDGKTWPEKYHRLIDSGSGSGYSCMTKIDDKYVGILYEGSQADLIFQKFSIDEILVQ
jgi:sialidase-1